MFLTKPAHVTHSAPHTGAPYLLQTLSAPSPLLLGINAWACLACKAPCAALPASLWAHAVSAPAFPSVRTPQGAPSACRPTRLCRGVDFAPVVSALSCFSFLPLPRCSVAEPVCFQPQISAEGHFSGPPAWAPRCTPGLGWVAVSELIGSVCNGTLIRALVQAVVVLLTCCPQLGA